MSDAALSATRTRPEPKTAAEGPWSGTGGAAEEAHFTAGSSTPGRTLRVARYDREGEWNLYFGIHRPPAHGKPKRKADAAIVLELAELERLHTELGALIGTVRAQRAAELLAGRVAS